VVLPVEVPWRLPLVMGRTTLGTVTAVQGVHWTAWISFG
jgi:hypothetical protein